MPGCRGWALVFPVARIGAGGTVAGMRETIRVGHVEAWPPTRRISKRSPLPLPDYIAQHVYKGRLMLGDHGMVWDTATGEWYDVDHWPP